MDVLHQLAPGTAMGSSIRDVADFFQAMAEDRIERFTPRGDALQIPTHFGDRSLITPSSVAAAHRVGLAMHVWTVNDETEMRALLELGVDGLMSDYPGLLVRIAREASR